MIVRLKSKKKNDVGLGIVTMWPAARLAHLDSLSHLKQIGTFWARCGLSFYLSSIRVGRASVFVCVARGAHTR